MKIAFIGAGNMASALIGRLVQKGSRSDDVIAIDPGEAARELCTAAYGIATFSSVHEVDLQSYDAIVLAVKPLILRVVAADIASSLSSQLVLSVAAGIRLEDLSRWLGGYRQLVRTMPNTPAQIGLGATGLVALPEVDDRRRSSATLIMEAVGMTVWVEHESQLDAVTAVSGSGPAYVFYFIEAMCEAGVQMGLSVDQARILALATFNGASQLASGSCEPPEVLRERVTSKGGTTAEALSAFDKAHLKERIIDGVSAAKLRAAQIGNELGMI